MKPLHGEAGGGETVDPEELEELEELVDKPRAAPAPRVPVSDKEFESLKEAAKHKPTPCGEESQEDRPKEKG